MAVNMKARLRKVLFDVLGPRASVINLDDAVEICMMEFHGVPAKEILRDFLAAYLQFKGYAKAVWAKVQSSDRGRKYYLRRLKKFYSEYGERIRTADDFYRDFRCRCGAKVCGDVALVMHALDHEDPVKAGGRVIRDRKDYEKLPWGVKLKVLDDLIERYYTPVDRR